MEQYSNKVRDLIEEYIKDKTIVEDIECIKEAYNMQMCGCGNNTLAIDYVYNYLKIIEQSKDLTWQERDAKYFSEGERYFFLYWADEVGFTEHGGSVNSSWLTDKGKSFIQDYEVFMKSEDYE